MSKKIKRLAKKIMWIRAHIRRSECLKPITPLDQVRDIFSNLLSLQAQKTI